MLLRRVLFAVGLMVGYLAASGVGLAQTPRPATSAATPHPAPAPKIDKPLPAPPPTPRVAPSSNNPKIARLPLSTPCEVCLSPEPKCSERPFVCSKEAIDLCKAAAASNDCRNPTSSCYPSYFRRHGRGEPQKAIESLIDSCPSNAADLERSSGLGKERVGGGELLLSVVGALQGFFEERAKAEAVDYTVDQLRDRLCTDEFAKYAVQTCQLLKSEQLNLDEATLVRLKQALLADLGQLAARVVAQLPPTNDPRQRALRLFAQSGVETAVDFSLGRIPLHEIPSTWASKDQSAYATAKLDLQCSMIEKRMPSACWVLLVPELGKTAVELEPEPKPEDIAAVIERAAQGFCATYGAEKQKENGSCLLGEKSQLEDLNSDASSDMSSGAFITRRRRIFSAVGGNSGSKPISAPRAR